MRLATIRTAAGHRAVRVDDRGRRWRRATRTSGRCSPTPTGGRGPRRPPGRRTRSTRVDYAPLVPAPEKIICVGLNYRDHVLEMGNELPEYPTVFAKFAPALIGAHDDIVLPAVSDKVDWEAELTVVIGAPVRHADAAAAEAAIAGYTVMNDVSVRDFQNRTKQFLQGKTFEHSTPLGPHLVTPDELPAGGWAIGTTLDGETVQSSSTDQLVFGPVELIVYLSQIVTLNPGDVIATGTPGRRRARPQAPALPHRRHRGRHVGRGGRRAAQHLPRGEAVTGKSPPAVTDSLAWAADGAAHLRGLMSRLGDDAFRAPSLLPGLEPRARADPPRPQRRRHDQPAAVGAHRDRHPRLRQRRSAATPTSRRARSARRPRSATTSSPRPTGWPPSCATCRKRPGRRWSPTCRAG